MKQIIFINTFVQPDRFCFVHLISVEQQNWSRGWALSNLQTYPAYLASAASFGLLISLIFQRGIRKPHHSGMYYQAGFTAQLALAMAIPWPRGSLQLHRECHQQTASPLRTYQKKRNGIMNELWPPRIWDFRGNLQIFQRPDYFHVPNYRALSVQPFFTESIWRQRDAQPWGTATTDQLDCGATEPTVPD